MQVYNTTPCRFLVFLLFVILVVLPGCTTPSMSHGADSGERLRYIDCHNHLFGGSPTAGRGVMNYPGAARSAVTKMDELDISSMIVMPPPISPENSGSFSLDGFLDAINRYPDRFAFLAGGESLNVMIHQTARDYNVGKEIRAAFMKKALKILEEGAIGFGEFAVEHFSFNFNHPYESVRADHPLFLMLSDIAAEHRVPVDIHMEAIPRDMPLPDRMILLRSQRNPQFLRENIKAFERLLSHNRDAKIIWAHVGWCNTGYRTPELCGEMMKRHPNLYMSFKLSRESVHETRPLKKGRQNIKPEWLRLIRKFPGRFIIGTDQFYSQPGGRQIGPQKTRDTRIFMDLLPPELARKIGIENPKRIFNLGP
ncbi:amidohydrolase family protein [Thermodesulfobacteriota bacterium]